MNKPIHLGLIGCGGIVRQQHLPALLDLDTVQVVAVADPLAENRDAIGEAASAAPERRYGDYRAMLAKAELDVVVVATPHNLHAEQVVAAAEAGLSVISEKPMATSLAEADQVLEAVARRGIAYSVVHNALFTPGTRRACELLQSLDQPQVGRAKSGGPMAEDRADPATVWRASKAAGGGCIGDTAYHEIYLLETLMGSPVRYVEARVQTRFLDIDVDDVALLLLEHENGALSTVSTSWGMPHGVGELGGCEVHPRGDCLHLVGRGRELHRFIREEARWEEIELEVTERNRTGHAGYFKATFAALAQGAALPITGEMARHNLAIIEAARQATGERRAIDLTEL